MILRPKVTAPGQRASLSVLLDEGQRAVTVRVDDIKASPVSFFRAIGLMWCCCAPSRARATSRKLRRRPSGIRQVLAIDQLLNERSDQPAVATVAKAVTLQVSPEQAQKLLLAGNVGKLSLVLRQPPKGNCRRDGGSRIAISAGPGARRKPGPRAQYRR